MYRIDSFINSFWLPFPFLFAYQTQNERHYLLKNYWEWDFDNCFVSNLSLDCSVKYPRTMVKIFVGKSIHRLTLNQWFKLSHRLTLNQWFILDNFLVSNAFRSMSDKQTRTERQSSKNCKMPPTTPLTAKKRNVKHTLTLSNAFLL